MRKVNLKKLDRWQWSTIVLSVILVMSFSVFVYHYEPFRSGFEITDKIKITLSKNPQTDDAVNEYNDYIRNQVLGTSLTLADNVENGTELNFDDFSLYVSVVKE